MFFHRRTSTFRNWRSFSEPRRPVIPLGLRPRDGVEDSADFNRQKQTANWILCAIKAAYFSLATVLIRNHNFAGSPLSSVRRVVIKGPGLRLACDVRRFWECPSCGTSARVAGSETFRRCRCRPEGIWMKLVDPTPPHPEFTPRPAPVEPASPPKSTSQPKAALPPKSAPANQAAPAETNPSNDSLPAQNPRNADDKPQPSGSEQANDTAQSTTASSPASAPATPESTPVTNSTPENAAPASDDSDKSPTDTFGAGLDQSS